MIIKNMRVCINKEICRVTAYHEIDEISLVIATKGDDKVYGKKRSDGRITVVMRGLLQRC